VTITAADIVTKAFLLPRDVVNPGGGCVYSDEQGNHCIAGEILVRLDLPVPEYGEMQNTTTVDHLDYLSYDVIEPDALELLADLQMKADETVDPKDTNLPLMREDGGIQRTWGEVVDRVLGSAT
jgi:hypothetical protein